MHDSELCLDYASLLDKVANTPAPAYFLNNSLRGRSSRKLTLSSIRRSKPPAWKESLLVLARH